MSVMRGDAGVVVDMNFEIKLTKLPLPLVVAGVAPVYVGFCGAVVALRLSLAEVSRECRDSALVSAADQSCG